MFAGLKLPKLFQSEALPYDSRTPIGKALNTIERTFLENTKNNTNGILYLMDVNQSDGTTAFGDIYMMPPKQSPSKIPFEMFLFQNVATISITGDPRGDCYVFPNRDASDLISALIRHVRPNGYEWDIAERNVA